MKQARGPLQQVRADVPMPIYDTWRRVVVMPLGMTRHEEVQAVSELMRERRL